MSNDFSPYHILSAVKRIEAELGAFTSEDSSLLHDIVTLREKLEQSKQEQEQIKLAAQLIARTGANNQVKKLLNAELALQRELWDQLVSEIPKQISLKASEQSVPITTYALNWQLDPANLPEVLDINERNISIKRGGIGTGKTIKLKNMSLDIGEMSEIAAGAMLAGFEMIDKPNPLVIVAGILLTLRALTKAMTVELSENEVSVFWGMTKARSTNNLAEFDTILQYTNSEREEVGLDPLTDKQILNALTQLEQLESIERVPGLSGTWRIIERFKIK